MAGEWFSESYEDNSPSRHVRAYGEQLNDPNNARYEFLLALEDLIRDELQLNDAQLNAFLEGNEAKLLDYERSLAADEEIEDKGRLQMELFAMASLILLWSDLRHLCLPEAAAEWLEEAVDTALNEADFHEDCMCNNVASDDNSCELSPLCPMEMIAKTLAAEAIEEPKEGALILEDRTTTIEMVRLQLILAGQKGLLTDRQVKKLLKTYHRNRRAQFFSDDLEE
jgi:hypothetical protein